MKKSILYNKSILKKNENIFFRKEIEKHEKEKVQNMILQKKIILSGSDFFNKLSQIYFYFD